MVYVCKFDKKGVKQHRKPNIFVAFSSFVSSYIPYNRSKRSGFQHYSKGRFRPKQTKLTRNTMAKKVAKIEITY